VETESGQTFVSIFTEHGRLSKGNSNDDDISNRALGIIQLVTTWECYTKSLVLKIDSIKRFIQDLGEKTTNDAVQIHGEMMCERLDFLHQKGDMMLYKAQWVKDRASAQVSAVRACRQMNKLVNAN
jgi:phosphoribosylanthranilate isomerase